MAAVTHHLPPDPGVTEIRVHGVGGTTPEALLEQTGLRQVTGDDKAGMFRGVIPQPGRAVEAYSWGGLTARSKSRALWVLLLPFSIVNLAGWMVEPPRKYTPNTNEYETKTWERTAGTKWHEVFVQLIAVTTTTMYVMWAALLTMNVLAFQCGALEECRRGRWYVDFFGSPFFVDHPGRRILVAAIVPVGLLVFFWALGTVSRSRYDEYGEADRVRISGDAGPGAASAIGITRFWYMPGWQRDLARIHVAMALCVLGGLLARAAGEFEAHFGVEVVPDGLPSAVFTTAFVVSIALAIALGVATWRSEQLLGAGVEWLRRVAFWGLVAAAGISAVAGWLTWRLDVADARLFEPLPGQAVLAVPVPNTDLWGFGWAPILLLGIAALYVGAFSAVQLWRWFVWRLVNLDQLVVPVMLTFIVLWPSATWVAVAAALNGVAAQWLPELVARSERVTRVKGTGEQLWRLGVYLAVCGVAAVAAWLTRELDAPFGAGWPRLTPILLFTAVLVVLSLVRASGGKLHNPSGRVAPLPARLAIVAIPVGLVVGGATLEGWLGGGEWLPGMALLALTVAAIAWMAQFPFEGWRWNGPAAIAGLGLAVVMGAFSGLVIWLVDLLDRDGTTFGLRATAIYEWMVVAFAAMVIAIAAGFAAWHLLVRLRIGDHSDGSPIAKTEVLPETLRALDVVITMAVMLMVTGVTALLVHLEAKYGTDVAAWINDGAPEDWRGIVQGAAWIALGLPVGAFAAVRSGLRDHAFRTRFGILWDVASFWPRSFHPFAPPAYATRAVPELQARLCEIAAACGDPRSPGGAILSGHSQGSVVSLAAVATLQGDARARVRLVTHGSPLVRFYQRFFPRYFPPALFDYCAKALGPTSDVADGGWVNFWRRTDPIGDPVCGASERDRPAGRPPAAVLEALNLSESRGDQLPDVRLADPLPRESPYSPQPAPRKHSGYMADPAMHRAIDALAAELAAAAPAARGGPGPPDPEPPSDPG